MEHIDIIGPYPEFGFKGGVHSNSKFKSKNSKAL